MALGRIEFLFIPLFLLSITVLITDLTWGKIFNHVTYPALLLGVFHGAFHWGWTGFSDSALGLIVGFILFLPLYFLGVVAAGDVKLLAAYGAWGGWVYALNVALGSLVFGGLIAVGILLFQRRLAGFSMRSGLFLSTFLKGDPKRAVASFDRTSRFPFALALAPSALLCTQWSFLKGLGILS